MKKPTEAEIQDKKTYFVNEYHGQRVTEQNTDESYYKDIFKPVLLKPPAIIQHTGTASRLIDAPAEHIITSNPQAFRRSRTKGEIDKASTVAKFLNWYLWELRHQNPNPIKEHPKMTLKRGEGWYEVIMNSEWKSGNRTGLPFYLAVPDPLTIFGSPAEFGGVPEEVIISCKRNVFDIQKVWPNWKPKSEEKAVEWLGYYSAQWRYFEADNIPVTNGVEKNILGFVPYVHRYSGFGSTSSDGGPETLAVGRLRYVRDILEEECILTSDAVSLLHRHTYPYKDFQRAAGMNIPDDAMDGYTTSPYGVNLYAEGVTAVPMQDLLANLNHIYAQLSIVRARLDREMSPVLEGAAVGYGSGRYVDKTGANALRRYDTIVEGTELSLATALGMGLRIMFEQNDMLPMSIYSVEGEERLQRETTINKSDIDGYYDCELKLKAADAIEEDREAMMYKQGWQAGLFSAKTTLVKGFNMTEDEADEEIDQRMVDDATINFPPWKMLMGMQFAQKQGIPMEVFSQIMGGATAPTPKGREPEVKTQLGREMIDESVPKGVRGFGLEGQ